MESTLEPQIFLGIQGASGTGKSFAAATFPNPLFLDIDKGLTAMAGRKVLSIPFWDDAYCVNVLKMVKHQKTGIVNKRDGIKKWIDDEGPKLTSDQTLILDTWTSLQICFDRQTELEPVYARKTGFIDEFAFWERKITYSRDILESLKTLKCHVVVLFHELVQRDATGQLTDKIQPLMQGKFVSSIPVPFSDFFRQIVVTRTNERGTVQKLEGIEIKNEREWYWQIKSDNVVNLKSRMIRPEKYVPANYSSFTYNK